MTDVRALMRILGERPVVVYPALRRLVGGSWAAAAVLSQLLYWHRQMDGARFWKTDADLRAELDLGDRELRTAKQRLRALPFVSVEIQGMPARTYYEIDLEGLAAALAAVEEPEGVRTGSDPRVPSSSDPGVRTSSDPTRRTDQEEITAETTPDISATTPGVVGRAALPGGGEMEELVKKRRVRSAQLDALEQGRKAAAAVAQAVLKHAGRDVWGSFWALARNGASDARWNRWIMMQIQPHLRRLGPERFARALEEGVIAASRPDIRSPAAVIVARLEATKQGAGGRQDVKQQAAEPGIIDLDELLGPIEEGANGE
ncbi:hypothetical protein [Oceanithermus sp.]|uniref:hypothetical protein n=1 Tax=Oceanithermus sp. TaxID=2268145 RepID=UPI0026000519|nr:hypothetical protein [Oceanithermus sp.]